jgi:hypothetical protein
VPSAAQNLEIRLARLEVHVETTLADVAEIKEMVMELRDARNRSRGAGAVLVRMVGLGGLFAAGLGWLISHLPRLMR